MKSTKTVFCGSITLGNKNFCQITNSIVIKGKHQCSQFSDNTATLEYFSYRERLLPNAKLYCANLNNFTFDKHNQGWYFSSSKDNMHIYA